MGITGTSREGRLEVVPKTIAKNDIWDSIGMCGTTPEII